VENLEARVTRIRRNLVLDLEVAVVEPIAHEANALHMRFRELKNAHGFLVDVTGVKKFDAKRQVVPEPEGAVVAKAR